MPHFELNVSLFIKWVHVTKNMQLVWQCALNYLVFSFYHPSLDSSVGRAEDCSRLMLQISLGRWFNSGSREYFLLLFWGFWLFNNLLRKQISSREIEISCLSQVIILKHFYGVLLSQRQSCFDETGICHFFSLAFATEIVVTLIYITCLPPSSKKW